MDYTVDEEQFRLETLNPHTQYLAQLPLESEKGIEAVQSKQSEDIQAHTWICDCGSEPRFGGASGMVVDTSGATWSGSTGEKLLIAVKFILTKFSDNCGAVLTNAPAVTDYERKWKEQLIMEESCGQHKEKVKNREWQYQTN
ncbi:hypothetical protein G6F43_010734 [Rhizopus delemar]|nr:hypothetical protein G6F43_010734 [Rhizopus delemar]